MPRLVQIFFSLIFILIFSHVAISQNIFILERPGSIKNYKYWKNDKIQVGLISQDTIIKGIINEINDSSLIINYANEVLLDDIKYIYRKRWGFSFLQVIFFMTGVPYLALSTFNGIINNDSPIVHSETLLISGSLIAAGIAITPLTSRRHNIDNKRWRVKILDFTD